MNKKKIITNIMYISIFLALIYVLEWWGALGFLVFILFIAGMRAYKMRDFLKQYVRQIEIMIWGKPLDKEAWEKGELKNTKIEIVWGKGNIGFLEYAGILLYPSILILVIGIGFDRSFLVKFGIGLLILMFILKGIHKWRLKNARAIK